MMQIYVCIKLVFLRSFIWNLEFGIMINVNSWHNDKIIQITIVEKSSCFRCFQAKPDNKAI